MYIITHIHVHVHPMIEGTFQFHYESVYKDWCYTAFTEPSIQSTRKGMQRL